MSKPQGYIEPDPTFNICLFCDHFYVDDGYMAGLDPFQCDVDYIDPEQRPVIMHNISPIGYCPRFERR